MRMMEITKIRMVEKHIWITLIMMQYLDQVISSQWSLSNNLKNKMIVQSNENIIFIFYQIN